jgi:hypothetical protein
VPIAPKIPDKLAIPAIKFVYFNPETRKYETSVTQSITVDVSPGKPGAGAPQLPAQWQQAANSSANNGKPRKSDQGLKLDDIRHIKLRMATKSTAPTNLALSVTAQALPFVVWVGMFGYRVYRRMVLSDIGKYRFTKAFKTLKKGTTGLRKELNTLKPSEVVSRLYDLVAHYLADKMNIACEGITVDSVARCFTGRIKPESIEHLKQYWDELNFVRFAPLQSSSTKDDIADLITRAEQTLTELEYEI